MAINTWTQNLRALYNRALEQYKAGERKADALFDEEETKQLAALGLRPINMYDYVDDFSRYGEPDWDTVLLIVAVRRDYLHCEMQGKAALNKITNADLPPKTEAFNGVVWLPRIIRKAQGYLEGSLSEEIMYCCSGDRRFLTAQNLHPADFLRIVWHAKGDPQKILDAIR